MLFLVGLGLSDKDIPIGAIEICKKCDLYIDRFTSAIGESTVSYLSRFTGKRITELSRRDMEENVNDIIGKAATNDVAILVGGDPLIATTHKILYIEATRKGVKTSVIHANSIITTAIGESGMDFYRFGGTCTIPKWSEHYSPVSFYEKIEKNLRDNEHTILLLDYDSNKMSTLSIKEAITALKKAEEHYKKGLIGGKTKLIILHNMNGRDSKVVLTSIAEAESLDYNGVNVIILPAEPTAIEKEALEARTGSRW
jgi:diphthine synthase